MEEAILNGTNMIFVTDCAGQSFALEHDDITKVIFKALHGSGVNDRLLALNLADKVMYRLGLIKSPLKAHTVVQLEQMIRFVLNECGQQRASAQVNFVLDKVN
jgi:hypothetical protein